MSDTGTDIKRLGILWHINKKQESIVCVTCGGMVHFNNCKDVVKLSHCGFGCGICIHCWNGRFERRDYTSLRYLYRFVRSRHLTRAPGKLRLRI